MTNSSSSSTSNNTTNSSFQPSSPFLPPLPNMGDVQHSEPIEIRKRGLSHAEQPLEQNEPPTVMNSPLTTHQAMKYSHSPAKKSYPNLLHPSSPKHQHDSDGSKDGKSTHEFVRKASIVRAPSSLRSDGSYSTPGSAYFTQAMTALVKRHSSPLPHQDTNPTYEANGNGNFEARSRKGRIAWEGQFYSHAMKMNRTVRIYVPPSYYDLNTTPLIHPTDSPNPDALSRYPVIYFHDGQNAFSYMGPDINWGWGNWSIDSCIEDLASRSRAREVIVVAVDCSGDRYLDYRGPPYPYTEQEKANLHGPPHILSAPGNPERYESYKKFLIDELKPRVDLQFRTLSDASNTCVMGASMGGICALALCWDRPDIFGLCASLSGAFMVEHQHFLKNIIRKAKEYPTPEVLGRIKETYGHPVDLGTQHPPFRVYLDSGISDYQGGDDGLKETTRVKHELIRLGWVEGKDLMHVVETQPLSEPEMEKNGLHRHKWSEAKANMHNEFYWKLRVWKPLEFLFPPLDHQENGLLIRMDSEGHLPHPGPVHEYQNV